MADLFGGLDDQPRRKPQAAPVARASSNGRTSAFDAVNAGSTPAARSTPPAPPVENRTKAPPAARDPRMLPNLGRKPEAAKGKRVVVELGNGRLCGVEPVSTTTQPGWDADGSRWTLTGFHHDIAYYRIL